MQALLQAAPETVAIHRRFLYRYALSRLRHPETAEELVQETLLAALEDKAAFRGESALRTWLAAILKHKIVDWRRRQSRTPICASDLSFSESTADGDAGLDAFFDRQGDWVEAPGTWQDPEQALESKQFWNTLESCLAKLPPATARAFYLREIEGRATEEICEELGISQSNCWVMLHRARLCLRRSLEQRWFAIGRAGMTAAQVAEQCAPA